MKRARLQTGSVVFDKRRKTWNFLWCENGHRRTKRIGLAREFPTKTLAWRAAEPFRRVVENPVSSTVITVKSLVTEYRNEKMPQRIGKVSTHAMRHSYRSWMDAVGTSLAVQQKLMRHSDIRTTMNIYGDVVDG